VFICLGVDLCFILSPKTARFDTNVEILHYKNGVRCDSNFDGILILAVLRDMLRRSIPESDGVSLVDATSTSTSTPLPTPAPTPKPVLPEPTQTSSTTKIGIESPRKPSSPSKFPKLKVQRFNLKVMLRILGVFVALVLLGTIGWYFLFNPAPLDIRVTNLTDRSVTISWKTKRPSKGIVAYSSEGGFYPLLFAAYGKDTAYDDRDVSAAELRAVSNVNVVDGKVSLSTDTITVDFSACGFYYMHHVTISGLDPETKYYFMIGDGVRYTDGSGMFAMDQFSASQSNSVTTFKEAEDLRVPDPSYGSVYDVDANFVTDGVAYSTLEVGGDIFSPQSAVLNDEARWYIDIANARTVNGEPVSGYDETADSMTVYILSGNQGESAITDVPLNENAPAQDIGVSTSRKTVELQARSSMVSYVYAEDTCEDKTYGQSYCKGTTRCDKEIHQYPTASGCAWEKLREELNCVSNHRDCEGEEEVQTCGDGVCTGLENKATCPADCDVSQEPSPEPTEATPTPPPAGTASVYTGCVTLADGSYYGPECCQTYDIGECRPRSQCSTDQGYTIRDNLCGGGNNMKCCVSPSGASEPPTGADATGSVDAPFGVPNPPNSSCRNFDSSDGGSCYDQNVYTCKGGSTDGLCPGGSSCCHGTLSIRNDSSSGYDYCKKGRYCKWSGQKLNRCLDYPGANICISVTGNSMSCCCSGTGDCFNFGVLEVPLNTSICVVDGNDNLQWVKYTSDVLQNSQLLPGVAQNDCHGSHSEYVGATFPKGVCCKSARGEYYWNKDQTTCGDTLTEKGYMECSGYDPDVHQVCCLCGREYQMVTEQHCVDTCDNNQVEDTSLCTEEHGGVRGVSTVLGTTSSKAYIISDDLIFTPEAEGVYSVIIPGRGVASNVVMTTERQYQFFIDLNTNGVRDEEEELIDLGQYSVELIVSEDLEMLSIDLHVGYNYVSFEVLPELRDSCELIKSMNVSGSGFVTLLARFESGAFQATSYRSDTNTISGDCFPVVPGRGYIIRSFANETVTIAGYALSQPAPVSFDVSGWHLIGVNGSSRQYTAETLIDRVNLLDGITADNVTSWDSSVSRYAGIQKEDDTVYGFDFPVETGIGYFVRIAEGAGVWTPE